MKKFLRQNWIWILGFAAVFVLALTLRLIHLTSLPVFVDEAIYIRWSQIMANEATLRFLPLSDGKEPLFMWVLMFLIHRFSDPLFIGRAISVMTGLGSVAGVVVLTQLLFKNRLATLLSAFLYAISPFTLFFDRMALVDSMLTMFALWTFIFSYLAITRERYDFAMLAGFALGGAWLTKSTAILFVLMLPTLWLFADSPKKIFKLIGLTLPILVIGYAMFNILRLGPNFNLIGSRNLDYVYPLNHFFVSPLDPLKGHLFGIFKYFYLMGPAGLMALWLFGSLANWRKKWKELLVLSAWAIAPIIVTAEYFRVVTARYILFTIPFFIIIASSSVLPKSKLVKILVTFSLIAFILQSVNFDWKLLTNVSTTPFPSGEKTGYLTEWTAGYGIKEISVYLKSQIPDLKGNQKIVVGTEGYFGTLPDGLQMYVEGESRIVVIGVGLGFPKLPQSLIESRASGNKTYLVVNKSRIPLDPDKAGLTLVASYQKPLRDYDAVEYKRFGPQDSLLFFEVK